MMGVMMAFAKEIMTSVLRDGNFMQLLAGIALGMTVIVSVLSYGAWHFAGLQDSRTMAFVLFNRLCRYRSGDFPGRNDEMEFIHQTRMGSNSKRKDFIT